jgi:hypothetical protein
LIAPEISKNKNTKMKQMKTTTTHQIQSVHIRAWLPTLPGLALATVSTADYFFYRKVSN